MLLSDATAGNNGAFRLEVDGLKVLVIASDGEGWEHVSVSRSDGHAIPSWRLMCRIKELFWDLEDCVVQYHPPTSKYVNFHPQCLHLWRKVGFEFPQPPAWMVGPKS